MKSSEDPSLRAVLAAITSNSIVTVAKFIGWLFSFSPSMLAEAIHSFADTLNQLLLFVGIRHGAGKPTKMYPFGKGQARYVWNLVSAIGILFIGCGITTYHGFSALFNPQHLTHTGFSVWIPLGILILSFFVEGYSLMIAVQSAKQTKEDRTWLDFIMNSDDPTVVAVLLEDSVAILGVLLAFSGLWLSEHYASHIPDAIASIMIGLLLGVMAVVLAIQNGRILMGMSAGPEWEAGLREFIDSRPQVERVVKMATNVLSPGRFHLTVEVEFHGGILINRAQIEKDAESIRDGEDPAYILFETAERMVRVVGREVNRLEAEIHEEFPEIVLIDLEVN